MKTILIWAETRRENDDYYILYSVRYKRIWDEIAFVRKHPCDGDQFYWKVYPYDLKRMQWGYANALKEAKAAVEKIIAGDPVQLRLI